MSARVLRHLLRVTLRERYSDVTERAPCVKQAGACAEAPAPTVLFSSAADDRADSGETLQHGTRAPGLPHLGAASRCGATHANSKQESFSETCHPGMCIR
jgi:hypothetical protein